MARQQRTLQSLPGDEPRKTEMIERGRLSPAVSRKGVSYLRGLVGGRTLLVFELARPDQRGNTHRVVEVIEAASED